jgi:hypothetical protein
MEKLLQPEKIENDPKSFMNFLYIDSLLVDIDHEKVLRNNFDIVYK